MQVTELNDSIKVRAASSPGGKVTPRLFKHGHRTFRVKNVNTRWEDRDGNYKVLHLTVTVAESDDIFQLCFREKDLTWLLEKVRMEG